MTLQQLRDFVAIAHHGSVRAAARALGISQPALTKSIRNLEGSLHVVLFQRTTQGVATTEYARAFLPRAKAILRECAQARQLMDEMRGAKGGNIAFGLSTAPSLLLAPRVIADFRRIHPDVAVHLTSGLSRSLLPAVREGRLDFAIVPVAKIQQSDDLALTPLFKSDPVVVARRNHPLADAKHLVALQGVEWALLDGAARRNDGGSVAEMFVAHNLGPPKIALTCDSLIDCLNIVRSSDLLTALPRLVLSLPGLADDIVQVGIREQLPKYDISLVQRPSVPLSPNASKLVNMFVSYSRINPRRVSSNR